MLAQGDKAFASRTLNATERNCAVTERECLVVIWSLEIFCPYFNQLLVKIIKDHRTLEHLTSCKNLWARMIQWTLWINEFNVQTNHWPGSMNTVAVCLSRAQRLEVENEIEWIKCNLYPSWVINSRQIGNAFLSNTYSYWQLGLYI